MKEKKTLYIDLDNTTFNSTACIVQYYNQDFKYYKNFRPIDWTEINTYGFEELQCAYPDYVNHLWNQPRFFEQLQFMPYALETLEILSKYFNIVFVTMGFSPNLRAKEDYLSGVITFDYDLICVNMKKFSDKAHIDMSGGIFIDDVSKNLSTSNAEVKILFGDEHSWNAGWDGIRCYNWSDVLEILLPQYAARDDVERWIRKFKRFNKVGVIEDTFLNGYCYWFANMLHGVFAGEIFYEPVEGHFVTKINERFYDIRGDVTERYIGKEMYNKEIYLKRKNIINGCILKKD